MLLLVHPQHVENGVLIKIAHPRWSGRSFSIRYSSKKRP